MDIVYYRIARGDTLSGIVKQTYGTVDPAIIKLIVALNPHITNPNLIIAGDTIGMPDPSAQAAPGALASIISQPSVANNELGKVGGVLTQSTDEEAAIFTTLAKGLLDTNATIYDVMADGTKKAIPSLERMVKNYEQYKAGAFSKGVYDYRRILHIDEHSSKLGVVSKLLYDKKTPNEVLRIDLRKGMPKTGKIAEAMAQAKHLKRVTKGGNVVLTGVGLYITCQEIKAAPTVKEKNSILVEQAGSMAGSAAAVGLALLMFGTPVGWVGLIGLGVAATATGLGTGWLSRKYYDLKGNEVDFAGGLGVSQYCR
jgi:phage tail protein X